MIMQISGYRIKTFHILYLLFKLNDLQNLIWKMEKATLELVEYSQRHESKSQLMMDHELKGRRRVSDNQNEERGGEGEEVKNLRGSSRGCE
jgi:hypothetical protein